MTCLSIVLILIKNTEIYFKIILDSLSYIYIYIFLTKYILKQ